MNGFVNVVDVEATCWDGQPPPGQPSEIIEIGICVLNLETLERVEKRSIVVKPAHSEISAFCTQLTGWTPAAVADGVSLAEAVRILNKEFRSDSRTWLSWGDYDRHQFQRECSAKNLAYPFSSKHVNAKLAFANICNGGKKLGMNGALQLIGIPLEGQHHNGADDAWNIAGIVALLLRTREITELEDGVQTRR